MSYPTTVAEEGIKIIRHHDQAYEVPVRLVRWGGVLKTINDLGQYVFDENYGMADECCMLVWTNDSRKTSGFANAWPAVLKGGGTATQGAGSTSPGSSQAGARVGATFTDPPAQPDANSATYGFAPSGNTPGGNAFGSSPGHGAGFTFQDPANQPDANSPAHGGFGHPTTGNPSDSATSPNTPAPPGGNQNPQVPTGQGHGHCGTMNTKHQMLPLRDDAGTADNRFKALDVNFPDNYPKVPKGLFGIALAATDEYNQVPVFMPTDPRLFAVNVAGDARMGSKVCDLTEQFEVDKDRTAPLQSAFRVLKKPLGNANAISVQLGPSGCGDAEGGYVYDKAQGGGGDPGDGQDGSGRPSVASDGSSTGGGVHVGDGGQDVNNPVGGGPGQTQTDSNDYAIACLSVNRGGFIDVGSTNDKHNLGADADKTKINKAHISTKALFRRNKVEDGPLRFEKVYHDGQDFANYVKVHLAWAGEDWAWWTSSPIDLPTFPLRPIDPLTTDPLRPNGGTVTGGSRTNPLKPGDPVPPPSSETIYHPFNGAAGGSPGGSPVNPPLNPPTDGTRVNPLFPGGIDPTSPSDERHRSDFSGPQQAALSAAPNPFPSTISNGQTFLGMHSAMSSAMSLSQPQSFSSAGGVNGSSTGKGASNSPITGSMSSFGAQGGEQTPAGCAGGPTMQGASGDPWSFTTTPDSSRFGTGTASGGWVIHPPETTLADQQSYGMMPPNTPLSTTYFITAPNAFFGAGTPHLAIGGLNSGWSWGMDTATGDLIWRTHGNGVATNGIRFYLGTQNIAWYSGTANVGSFDHSNTNDRTYSFVDMTGQVEMFQVVGSNPNGVVNGILGTLAWDSAGHILYVNNDSATTWVAITGAAGPAGPPGPAGVPIIVTLTGTAVAGNGFKVVGTMKINGNYAPPGAATSVPDTSVTFALSQTSKVQLEYAFIWASGGDSLPALASGLFVDGVYYRLDENAENQGSGGDTTYAFGHSGSMAIDLTAGNHTISIGAEGDGRMVIQTSSTQPATISALIPTSIQVVVPDPTLPEWVGVVQTTSFLTIDQAPMTALSRQLIAPNPKRVSLVDLGPGLMVVLTGPQDIDIDSSPMFAGLTLTSPLSTTSGGTGLATIGSALQHLRVNAAGTALEYAAAGAGSSPLTTKGDIYTYDVADARLPVGADGQVLSADSTQATGLKWVAAAAGTGTVTSSGTPLVGRVAYFTTDTNITGDAAFIYSTANNSVGIGPAVVVGAAETLSVIGTETVASGAAATWNAINFQASTATITGGTTIATATGFNFVNIGRPTLTDGSAVTVTNAATFYVENSPLQAGSVTITNPYAIWVDNGFSRLDGGIDLTGGSGTRPSSGDIRTQRVFQIVRRNSANTNDCTIIQCSALGDVLQIGGITGWTQVSFLMTAQSSGASANYSFLASNNTGGANSAFLVTGGTHTGQTASTEINFANFNFAQTTTWATGAIATQRHVLFQAPTYAFSGASVLTTAATVAITGAPSLGTNATITNSYALWIQSGKTELDGALTVTGAAVFSSSVSIAGATTFAGTATFTGDVDFTNANVLGLPSKAVSYITLDDSAAWAPMARQLIAPNPNRVQLFDFGPSSVVVLTGPQDIDPTASPTFAGLYLSPTLAPVVLSNGQYWYDSTQLSPMVFAAGIKEALVGCIFTATAKSTALNNSASETSMIGTGVGSMTIPANLLSSGKTIRIRVVGTYTTGVTPAVQQIQCKIGAAALTVNITPPASGSSLAWEVLFEFTNQAGSVQASRRIHFMAAALANEVLHLTQIKMGSADPTIANLLDVTFQGLDAAATYQGVTATCEVLN